MSGKVFPRWLARGMCLSPCLPHPLATPLLAKGDTTPFPVLCSRLSLPPGGVTTFLEMS